jgi:tagaturonate epimerase
MQRPKYSIGVGDRFAHQGAAQLDAVLRAAQDGVAVAPVWNKSHREHSITGSRPGDVRVEADEAVAARGYAGPYFVDADHIGLDNVDGFLAPSDFFTLDVADAIGAPPEQDDLDSFVEKHRGLAGRLDVAGLDRPLEISEETVRRIAAKYLRAIRQAGAIYRRIAEVKGTDGFVTEVSMDETPEAQTPLELLVILAGVADEGIPAQTIAPRFSGRFNKGVDYVGDVTGFGVEFEQDLAVLAFAVERFGLPADLKLSVHSGSDKFSIYGPMRAALKKRDAGVHLKTAGTTWLEELIGLAAAGGDGLQLAKEIYRGALARLDELTRPYAEVIDIDPARLPGPRTVDDWPGDGFVAALRHDPTCDGYNPHLRQLLHVSYKVAAELGDQFTSALAANAEVIAENVTWNLYARHIRPLFVGD